MFASSQQFVGVDRYLHQDVKLYLCNHSYNIYIYIVVAADNETPQRVSQLGVEYVDGTVRRHTIQDSPRTSQDALRAKMFTRLLARDSADATLETFVCSEGLCFWHNKKLQGFRVCCWQEIKDWSQVGMGDASGQEPISPEVLGARVVSTVRDTDFEAFHVEQGRVLCC